MNALIFALTLILSVFTQIAISQDLPVPSTYVLRTEADYKEYEKEVIATIDWLEITSVKQMKEERMVANAFFTEWIMGAPDITIELNADILKFSPKNADLLVSFMGGWTKFALQNPDQKDDAIKCNLAGLEGVIRVYKFNKGNGMKKDKEVEKLIELQEKGELEKWVEKQLGKE
jgi:hypothetical protein